MTYALLSAGVTIVLAVVAFAVTRKRAWVAPDGINPRGDA